MKVSKGLHILANGIECKRLTFRVRHPVAVVYKRFLLTLPFRCAILRHNKD
jgi:hypothetical protein